MNPAAGSGRLSAGTAFSTPKNRRQDPWISPSVQHSDDPQRSLVRSVDDRKVAYHVKSKRSARQVGPRVAHVREGCERVECVEHVRDDSDSGVNAAVLRDVLPLLSEIGVGLASGWNP